MVQTEREYAQALFEVAAETGSTEEFLQCLTTVRELTQENPDYIELLASPAIPLTQRLAVIDEAFGSMPEYVVSFLKILCENGKVRSLYGCIDEYSLLAAALSNKAAALISSAVELSDKQKDAVCKKLAKITGKSIDAAYIIDDSLIGGMKIEVDGMVIDGSIRHRLGEIKDVMNS